MLTLLLILLILVYLILVLRYYYRTSNEAITIIQCDVHSFQPTLLQERQPIVCKGVGSIAAVQDFAQDHVSDDARLTSKTISARDATVLALYDRLNAGAWYHQHEHATLSMTPSGTAAHTPSPRQSWYDIFMTIQLRGTRRVRIYAPTETARLWRVCTSQHALFCHSERAAEEDEDPAAQYTDIVLSEGDALLLPMQWWIDDAPTDAPHPSGAAHVNLGWRNPFSSLHAVARSFL